MKGIIFDCKRVAYKDTRRSTRPGALKEMPMEFTKWAGRNRIMIFLCIEKGDTHAEVESAVRRLDFLNSEFHKSKRIFLVPFAHLSNKLEKPNLSIQKIKLFKESLQQIGYEVEPCSFGTHKEFMFHIRGNPASVSYFEFPYTEVN